MQATLRILLALVSIFAGAGAYAAESKPYARDFLASDAVRLTETLRKETAGEAALTKGKNAEQLRKEAAGGRRQCRLQTRREACRRGGDRQSQGRRQLAPALPRRRQGRRCASPRALRIARARHDRRLCRLFAADRAGAASRGAGSSGQSFCAPGNVASRARRLSRQPRPPRRSRHPEDLRRSARKIRISHHRLQGRQ